MDDSSYWKLISKASEKIRSAYRRALPVEFREPISRWRAEFREIAWPPRHGWANLCHELGWLLSSHEERQRIVKRRLETGDHLWLFLLGLNNSGTTLFLHIIEQHPEVRSMGEEGHQMEGQHQSRAITDPQYHGLERTWGIDIPKVRLVESDESPSALRVKYDWSKQFGDGPNVLFEKSTLNPARSRWLQDNFKPSKFIATFRSPYAVCEGIRRRNGYPIEQCAHHWSNANATLVEDMDHLDHVMTYTYEELCEEPEAVLSRVQTFAGLEAPFRCDTLGRVESHSLEGRTQGLKNMNPRSIRRLSDDDIQKINGVAGPVMEVLGYDRL
ncbi:hypothetical protein GGQ03_003160 [Salinibacter ruber]|uniref:sulfotransferase family protein n=1 Tax=Salinibacter ruber TaxID=146919 RepID=UPI002169A583|nr:hypothetical protein [Salinibacter ruber]